MGVVLGLRTCLREELKEERWGRGGAPTHPSSKALGQGQDRDFPELGPGWGVGSRKGLGKRDARIRARGSGKKGVEGHCRGEHEGTKRGWGWGHSGHRDERRWG